MRVGYDCHGLAVSGVDWFGGLLSWEREVMRVDSPDCGAVLPRPGAEGGVKEVRVDAGMRVLGHIVLVYGIGHVGDNGGHLGDAGRADAGEVAEVADNSWAGALQAWTQKMMVLVNS